MKKILHHGFWFYSTIMLILGLIGYGTIKDNDYIQLENLYHDTKHLEDSLLDQAIQKSAEDSRHIDYLDHMVDSLMNFIPHQPIPSHVFSDPGIK